MPEELLHVAVSAARAGASVLAGYFGASGVEVGAKGDNDLVSRADRESEDAVSGVIRNAFPDHRILAEEGGQRADGASEFEWIIDPLDGTTNFLHGFPVFAVSIGCRRRERLVAGVVLEPAVDKLFTAVRGGGAWCNGERLQVSNRAGLGGALLATGFPFRAQAALDVYQRAFRAVFLRTGAIRRCGSAALDLAYTAAGIFDGFFEFRLSPWDIAGGALLVLEAGGRLTDLDGGEAYLATGNVVAGPPALQEELRATIARHADEATLEALVPAPAPLRS